MEIALTYRPRLVCLARQSAVAILKAIAENQVASCVLPWIPLMSEGQATDQVNEWRRLVEAMPDDNHRKTLVDLALIFAQLTECREV